MHHIKIVKMEAKQMKTKNLAFSCGNPSVEEIKGIIHLYKDTSENLNSNVDESSLNSVDQTLPVMRTELLCVLAVPSYTTISDFASFTSSFHKSIVHMRIIRNPTVKHYMVILKMKDQKSADSLYLEFNNKPFNSMDPETCNVFFVSSVEFVSPSQTQLFPPSGQVEIPTCPVCLEKLDSSVTGILTMICNHSFHCRCISKWKGESSCPVCRYSEHFEDVSPRCSVCHTTESLWICLICGVIGCGRYVNEHARLHFKESHHQYALELQTNRVWDYVGDGYVHRIAQDKSGKLIPIPDPSLTNNNSEQISEGKVESISLEFSHLMEQQRLYFEEKLRRLEKEKNLKLLYLEEEYAHLLEEKSTIEKKWMELENQFKQSNKKNPEMQKKLKDLEKENKLLTEINDTLKKAQQKWQEKAQVLEKKILDDNAKEKKIKELEEQIQDLMFFIDAKKKIESNEELKQGEIIIAPNPQNELNSEQSPNTGGFKKKKKKKN